MRHPNPSPTPCDCCAPAPPPPARIRPAPPLPPPHTAGEKIHVGFISRFFRNHTIGRLNMGLTDQLNREEFTVTVFSVGEPQDEVAQFIRSRADQFVALPPSRLDVARR